MERVVLGGDAGRDDGDVPVPPEQHELRTRVEGEGCDGLLLVPYGEGRVQHGVGGDGVLEELQDGGFVLPSDEEIMRVC